MNAKSSLFAELRRRNVLRAGVLYIGAVWAFGQGLSQFSPAIGLPDWATRWFLIAAVIGFPFWIAFAWFYEFTPQGLKRESEIAPDDSIAHSTGRKLDRAIIAVLALAVVLLLTNTFVWRKGAGLSATANDAAAVAAKIPAKSIAVLPLTNESGDPKQQYFSDGLSEDLITALSQFAGLKVIGRNSSFQFRDTREDSASIGVKLGVAHLLEGSVRHAGDAVRVSAELINVADGSTLWSQHYDRPYQDLFVLQDDITKAVSIALKAKLLPGDGAVIQSDRPPSGNLDAYTAYLQGKFHDANNTQADDRKAIDFYNDAIRLDPRYADAYAGLSHVWTSHAAQFLSGADMKQAYANARAAAGTALSLDPNSASAHLARAYLLQSADFDWTAADAEFRRALQIAPENGGAKFMWGVLLATLGKPAPAVRLTQEALSRDPLHAGWYGWLAQYLLPLGRFDEAEAAIRRAIALQPRAVGQYETLTTIEVQRGDANAALRAAQQEPPGIWRDVALAMALQIGTDRAAADAALKTLIDKQAGNGPYQIAEVYALRKDPGKMFEWLDRAWANRDPGISSLLFDPFLLRYKDDPRFAAFCGKVGLPAPSAVTVPSAQSAKPSLLSATSIGK
ncbi:MAG: tetratricopeptide repeat protein [Rhodanobacteraceae bacterium]